MIPIDPNGESTTTWLVRAEKAEAELDKMCLREQELIAEIAEVKKELKLQRNVDIEAVHDNAVKMEQLKAERDRLKAALESIANNTCCEGCQEAAKVAQRVLDPSCVCDLCGGDGWIVEPDHHPNCDGSCRDGKCPVPKQVLCPKCHGEGVDGS